MPCHGLEDEGGIGDGAAKGANLIKRRGKGYQAVAGDQAVGGFKADNAAEGRRLTNRATRIGANRDNRLVSRDCCRRAARGAPRHTARVPGVSGGLKG